MIVLSLGLLDEARAVDQERHMARVQVELGFILGGMFGRAGNGQPVIAEKGENGVVEIGLTSRHLDKLADAVVHETKRVVFPVIVKTEAS